MDQSGLTTKTILDEGITKKESGSDIQGAPRGFGDLGSRVQVKTSPSQNAP